MFRLGAPRSWGLERPEESLLASWAPLGPRCPGPWGAKGPRSGEETVKIAQKCKRNAKFDKKCEKSAEKCKIHDFSSRRTFKIHGFA